MFIKRHHQPSKISFLSLLLKITSEGASLTSEHNWFQSLGPRNEIDFCPFNVLKRGTRKSALVFLSLIVVRAEFCTNSSDRYSGARPLFDLYIMVAASHRIMSEIVGHPSLLIRSAAETRKLLLVTSMGAGNNPKNLIIGRGSILWALGPLCSRFRCGHEFYQKRRAF